MTLNEIAREFDSEPFEIAAALDIPYISDDQEVTEFSVNEIHEIFGALAELKIG